MRLQKTITIYIEEEPEKANAGDLLFQKYQDSSIMNPKKSETHWSVHRYVQRSDGGFWAALSRFTHYNYIKETYGVNLEGK